MIVKNQNLFRKIKLNDIVTYPDSQGVTLKQLLQKSGILCKQPLYKN